MKKEKLDEIEVYNSEHIDNLYEMNKKIKKTSKVIKIIAIIVFIVIIFSSIISTNRTKYSRIRKNIIKNNYSLKIEEISERN